MSPRQHVDRTLNPKPIWTCHRKRLHYQDPGSPEDPSQPEVPLTFSLSASSGLLPKAQPEENWGPFHLLLPCSHPLRQKASEPRLWASWGGEQPWHPAPGTRPSPLSDPVLTRAHCLLAKSPCQGLKSNFRMAQSTLLPGAICIFIIINYCNNYPSHAA